MKFITNYKAYWEFLRADNFPPLLNELGNIVIVLVIMLAFKYLNLAEAGWVLGALCFIRQRLEAYRVGGEWLRNGKDVQQTKQFVVGKKFAKYA